MLSVSLTRKVSLFQPMSEVRVLREEMAELRQSNAELRGMVKELIAATAQARH